MFTMMLPVSFPDAGPLWAPGRFTSRESSLVNTAVMMKKISRFNTKSSIGARSMPVDSSVSKCRRSRISEGEPVGEELGLPPGPRLEVEDRVEPRDADGEARHGAEHRVGDAAGHRARVGRAPQGHG